MYIKILLFVAAVLFSACSRGTNLTPQQHIRLHTYTQKPSLQTQKEQQMHQIHRVDEAHARTIAENATKERVVSIKLRHIGQRLLYRIRTRSYLLEIDAMDGKILRKVSHE